MNRQDEYRADNVFWVMAEARWQTLQDNAKQLTIGELIDEIADVRGFLTAASSEDQVRSGNLTSSLSLSIGFGSA